MGYCPSVLILKPGQLIHINKGRLHAFRKLSIHKLPVNDCHATLRADVLLEEKLEQEQLCMSVAWDWMFQGVTEAGIHREVSTAMECAALNRINGVQSLGIPEASLLQTAKYIRGAMVAGPRQYPPPEVICRGILPSLRMVVDNEMSALVGARTRCRAEVGKSNNDDPFNDMDKSDACADPLNAEIDPYGNEDYTCKICSKELANVYCHCNGCDTMLGKDFNICVDCHEQKKHRIDVMMGRCERLQSSHHHTGSFGTGKSCTCQEQTKTKKCFKCQRCACCWCKCHSDFSVHCRFFDEQAASTLVSKVEGMGKKPDNYVNRFLAGQTSKRCALFPICREDSSYCGGFQASSCWCFKERLMSIPSKEELEQARRDFAETNKGKEVDERRKKLNNEKRKRERENNRKRKQEQ